MTAFLARFIVPLAHLQQIARQQFSLMATHWLPPTISQNLPFATVAACTALPITLVLAINAFQDFI
jgi:branched-subunit amino acid transport protein